MVLSKLNILMVESSWSSRARTLNTGLHLVLSPPLQTFREQGSGSDGFLWCYGQNPVYAGFCSDHMYDTYSWYDGACVWCCCLSQTAVLHFLHILPFSFYIFIFSTFIVCILMFSCFLTQLQQPNQLWRGATSLAQSTQVVRLAKIGSGEGTLSSPIKASSSLAKQPT